MSVGKLDFKDLDKAIKKCQEEDAKYIGMRACFDSETDPKWGTVIERYRFFRPDGPLWNVKMDNPELGIWLAHQHGLEYQLSKDKK